MRSMPGVFQLNASLICTIRKVVKHLNDVYGINRSQVLAALKVYESMHTVWSVEPIYCLRDGERQSREETINSKRERISSRKVKQRL